MTVHTTEVLDAMEKYGGSFVKALAAAWRAADSDNSFRLHLVFQHYWDRYLHIVVEDKERQEQQTPPEPDH